MIISASKVRRDDILRSVVLQEDRDRASKTNSAQYVRPLVLLFKQWAKFWDLIDTPNNKFAGVGITVLLLALLKNMSTLDNADHTPPALPSGTTIGRSKTSSSPYSCNTTSACSLASLWRRLLLNLDALITKTTNEVLAKLAHGQDVFGFLIEYDNGIRTEMWKPQEQQLWQQRLRSKIWYLRDPAQPDNEINHRLYGQAIRHMQRAVRATLEKMDVAGAEIAASHAGPSSAGDADDGILVGAVAGVLDDGVAVLVDERAGQNGENNRRTDGAGGGGASSAARDVEVCSSGGGGGGSGANAQECRSGMNDRVLPVNGRGAKKVGLRLRRNNGKKSKSCVGGLLALLFSVESSRGIEELFN